MSITDELREYAHDNIRVGRVVTGGLDDLLLAIADRIDAEHEVVLKALVCAQAERDEYLDSIRLWEFKCSSMVELPRDADGEPIHAGDELETDNGKRFKVKFLTVNECEWLINSEGWHPSFCRHYHAPTLEDVLRELLIKWEDTPTSEGVEGIISECAAKVREVMGE